MKDMLPMRTPTPSLVSCITREQLRHEWYTMLVTAWHDWWLVCGVHCCIWYATGPRTLIGWHEIEVVATNTPVIVEPVSIFKNRGTAFALLKFMCLLDIVYYQTVLLHRKHVRIHKLSFWCSVFKARAVEPTWAQPSEALRFRQFHRTSSAFCPFVKWVYCWHFSTGRVTFGFFQWVFFGVWCDA